MATDRYIKTVLTIIALALTVLAVRPWLPETRPAHAQVPKYEVSIPKEWGKFMGYNNNNLLLEAPDKTMRVVDIEGRAPEYPKIKALIRWQ